MAFLEKEFVSQLYDGDLTCLEKLLFNKTLEYFSETQEILRRTTNLGSQLYQDDLSNLEKTQLEIEELTVLSNSLKENFKKAKDEFNLVNEKIEHESWTQLLNQAFVGKVMEYEFSKKSKDNREFYKIIKILKFT